MKKSKALLVIGIIVIVAASVAVSAWYAQTLMKPPEAITWAEWGGPYEATVRQIAQQYEQKTGHHVNIVLHAGASSSTFTKIKAAWPNVVVDVYASGAGTAYQACQGNYAIALTQQDIPNLAQIPKNLNTYYQGNVCGVAEAPASWVLAWRTDYVKKNLTSFNDLLAPEFKHKVAISDPTQGTGQFLIAAAYAFGGNETNLAPGWDFAKKLAQSGNIGLVYTSEADLVNALTTGQAWIGFGGAWNVRAAIQQGAPLAFSKVVDSTIVVNNDIVTIMNGPRQAIAKDFVNYLLSPEINQQYAAGIGYPPANVNSKEAPAVAPWYPTPQQYAQYGHSPDPSVVSANFDSWVKQWQEQIVPLIH